MQRQLIKEIKIRSNKFPFVFFRLRNSSTMVILAALT